MKTIEEIAKKEGKSPRWVRMQAAQGKFKCIKVAGTWIILEKHEMLIDLRKLPKDLRIALLGAELESDAFLESGIAS
jgi:hypothetical protein